MNRLIFLIAAVLIATAQLYSQWVLQSNPMSLYDDIYAVFPVSATTVYAVGENDVVLKTTNMGTNWFYVRRGLYERNLSAIWFFDENTGIVAGDYPSYSFNRGLISKTTNGGTNWKDTIIDQISFMSLCFINANTGFAGGGTRNTPNSPLYKTTDAGLNWVNINSVPNSHIMGAIHFINENTGWASGTVAGVGEVIMKTTNGGNNWSTVASFGGSASLFSIYFVNPNTGWISGHNLLQKSTDAGTIWIQQSNHNTGYIWSLFFLNENTGWAAGSPPSMQKTTNGGINWNMQAIQTGLWLYDVKFFNENVGWAVGSQGKIFYTSNGGGPVSVQNISTEVPSAYSLSQNYPNPFNPVTNFKFSILNSGDVKLVVYDVMGREVQTLVNERLQAGTYETKFDGSMLNSGVYFYKLITDGFIETKRMLMIK